MFNQIGIIIELFKSSRFAKFSIERTFNFIIFRALLSNELYFSFRVLLCGDFNVQLDVKTGIIIVM